MKQFLAVLALVLVSTSSTTRAQLSCHDQFLDCLEKEKGDCSKPCEDPQPPATASSGYNCDSPEVVERLRYLEVCSDGKGGDYCRRLALSQMKIADIQNYPNDVLAARCKNTYMPTKRLSEIQTKAWDFYCSLMAESLKETEIWSRNFKPYNTDNDPNAGWHRCSYDVWWDSSRAEKSTAFGAITREYDGYPPDSAAQEAFDGIINGGDSTWEAFMQIYNETVSRLLKSPPHALTMDFRVETDDAGQLKLTLRGYHRPGQLPPTPVERPPMNAWDPYSGVAPRDNQVIYVFPGRPKVP